MPFFFEMVFLSKLLMFLTKEYVSDADRTKLSVSVSVAVGCGRFRRSSGTVRPPPTASCALWVTA